MTELNYKPEQVRALLAEITPDWTEDQSAHRVRAGRMQQGVPILFAENAEYAHIPDISHRQKNANIRLAACAPTLAADLLTLHEQLAQARSEIERLEGLLPADNTCRCCGVREGAYQGAYDEVLCTVCFEAQS